jgi:hypothetical protein
LAAWRVHEVESINITVFTGSAAGCAEGDFAKSTDFAHGIWTRESIDNINLIAALVSVAQEAVRSQFIDNKLSVNRVNYTLVHYYFQK